MDYFYCYSIKLKNWLKLNGVRFVDSGKHSNGNTYWRFSRDDKLDQALTDWKTYKHIFFKDS